jgi:hypothetical protein
MWRCKRGRCTGWKPVTTGKLVPKGLDDVGRAVEVRVGLAKGFDHSFTTGGGGTKIDKQHLIVALMDDLQELALADR